MTTGSAAGACSLWYDPADEDPDGEPLCSPNLSAVDAELAAQIATDVLYVLTNRQWPGVCPRVVRPAFSTNATGLSCWAWWQGSDPDPRYPFGWASPFRTTRGAPAPSKLLRLPGPVAEVTKVVVDGVDLPTAAYQLVGSRTLRRLDGDDWPTTNDLERLASDPGDGSTGPAWEVQYGWGSEPPAGATAIARTLFCEIGMAMDGQAGCRLMWGAKLASVSRRGVQVAFESIATFLEKGLTGIDEVDVWVTIARGGKWRPRGGGRVKRADARKRVSQWRI